MFINNKIIIVFYIILVIDDELTCANFTLEKTHNHHRNVVYLKCPNTMSKTSLVLNGVNKKDIIPVESAHSNSFKIKSDLDKSPQQINNFILDNGSVDIKSFHKNRLKEFDGGNDSENVSLSDRRANNTKRTTFSIDCDDVILGHIDPTMVYTDTRYLKIESTGNLELKENWGHNFIHLYHLTVEVSGRLSIPDSCQWIPESVAELDISYTSLWKYDLKKCFSTLETLTLQGSNLKNLSLCMPFLKTLDASWNLLEGNGSLASCSMGTGRVEALRLHNNKLTNWSSCGWPSLVSLELQYNQIKNVNFSGCILHKLRHLDLSHNYLENGHIKIPHSIMWLVMSYNHIKHTFKLGKKLQGVDLSHNAISSIHKGNFHHASRLLSLDLSHNHLVIINGHDFKGLASLRTLDLSYNTINHIRPSAFIAVPFLVTLKLNNNKLHQLDSKLITGLPQNIRVQVHHNPWKCLCQLLASLQMVVRASCNPNCRQPELHCVDGKRIISVQTLLEQCLGAAEHMKSLNVSVHHFPSELYGSDEDLSEEVVDSGTQTKHRKEWAIGGALLLVCIPFIGFGLRLGYRKRKNIRKWCSRYFQRNSMASDEIVPDTDSETEV